MTIKIEIAEGANEVFTRTIKDKATGEIKGTFYNQFGYVYLAGERYPVKTKIPVESPAQAYPVGIYKLSLKSIRVGRFDALEIDPYNIILEKLDSK